MNTLGKILKEARLAAGKKLSDVGHDLRIDTAIISKLERGQRKATRPQVLTFVDYYQLNEQKVFAAWLSDKILYELQDEKYGLDALKVAEKQVKYQASQQSEAMSELGDELQSHLEVLNELQEKWSSKKPLNKTQLEKIREAFSVAYTYESNRIEGNTLTLQETHLIVNEGLTIGGKSMQEHLEAINHYEAIDFIIDLAQKKVALTERVIKQIHYLVLKGIDRENAGVYRKVPVVISGSSHKPPQPYLLDKEMELVLDFYQNNKSTLHPVILAAEMHERLVSVHPFIDGNGRTSRLLMNLILLQNGFTIVNLKGDGSTRLSYYNALESARGKDGKLPFLNLITQAAKASILSHLEIAGIDF